MYCAALKRFCIALYIFDSSHILSVYDEVSYGSNGLLSLSRNVEAEELLLKIKNISLMICCNMLAFFGKTCQP